MIYKLSTFSVSALLLGVLVPFSFSFAQNGSADPPVEPPPVETPLSSEPSATKATSTPTATDPQGVSAATTSSAGGSMPRSEPTPVNPTVTEIATSAEPAPTETQTQATSSDETKTNPLLWVSLFVLAALPFGYVGVGLLRNKKPKKQEDQDGARCFNIKQLLDKKLEELTDLRGRIQNEVQERIREGVRDAVTGTAAGEALALVEAAEKEYGRLKKLYEQCMVEFGGRTFKGVVVENSLRDKGILDSVTVEKTRRENDWTLHDVAVSAEQISEFSKHLADGPWYVHFWEPGKDAVKVVFKNKIFDIALSNKSTWAEAVAYGKSIGIPEEQLDFKVYSE